MKISPPTRLLLTILFALQMTTTAFAGQLSAYEKKYTADPFYAEIVSMAQKAQGKPLVDFIHSKLKESWAKRVHPAAIWLRNHSTAQSDGTKINALYFQAYAEVLKPLTENYQAVHETKTAQEMLKVTVQSMYIFEAIATADAVRCADNTALSALQFALLGQRDYIKNATSVFGIEALDDFAKTALLFEENSTGRAPNLDICHMGDTAALMKERGQTYQPQVLNDNFWLVQRDKALKDMKATWKMRHEFWGQTLTP